MTAGDRAWRIAAVVGAVALVTYGLSQLVPLLAHEERTFTRTFPTDGVEVVDVDLDQGTVEVVGADVEEIRVRVHVSEGLRATGHEQSVDGDRLVLTGECPLVLSKFCDVDYRVEVPKDVAVVADANGGRVVVQDLDGSVTAEVDNGSIELVDVEGDLELDSDNGSIRGEALRSLRVGATTDNGSVDLTFAVAPEVVTADSDNGSVVLRLPRVDGGYRVDTDADNGSIDVGVLSDPASDRLIVATTDNGDVAVLDAGS